MPAPQPAETLVQFLYHMGMFVPILILLTVSLMIWLVILFLRFRSLSEHIAYIAATFYPFLLGILGATVSCFYWVRTLGEEGVADYSTSYGARLAQFITEVLVQFGSGILLTCLFFPLGILALLIRKPK